MTDSAAYRRQAAADLEATMRAHDCGDAGRCTGEHFGEVHRYPCQAKLWAEIALELLTRR